MSEAILMPKLGMDMTEGTLISWTKNVGDTISAGDVIAEIETDKTTIEVEASAGGTILSLIGSPGDMLAVGTPIAYVGSAGEQAPAAGGSPAPTPAAAVPQSPADAKHKEVPASSPTPPPSRVQEANIQTPAPVPADGNGTYPGGVKASPLARKVAEDRGIDLSRVTGTGPGGRVTRDDVEKFNPADSPAAPISAPVAIPAASAPSPTFGKVPSGPDVEVIDTSKMRTIIGRRMVESKQQVPHFYVTSDMDVEALLALRKQLNDAIPDENQKISVNDLVVKATALTLRQFPNLNSHFYGDRIVRHKRINIGMAVALPNGGLMNVVAKDADRTALSTMAQHNREMIGRARDGKVKPDDVDGSTFTVSNLGIYDVDHFIAIVNPPEAGILAIGSAKKVPVVKPDGTLGIGTRMKVTISVDHRVSDGAEGAQFMQAFKNLIENPIRLVV